MRDLRLFLTAASALAVLAFFVPNVPAQDDGIQWLSSYKEAIAEAKRTGKPIFLEFRCEP